MAGFNRIQKPKEGTGLVYIRFCKTINEEQMAAYALKNAMRLERLPKEYDAGIFFPANEYDFKHLDEFCKKLMKDYDNVFIAREYCE